jgi:hypothetical protein
MRLGYVFIADEPVTMQQLPAFEDYAETSKYPGMTIPGEFDIHAWHRQLNWSFEWWDTDKQLIIKRGDPVTYAKFIVNRDPTERVDLVKLKMTDQIYNAIMRTSNTPSFLRNTFKLFEKASAIDIINITPFLLPHQNNSEKDTQSFLRRNLVGEMEWLAKKNLTRTGVFWGLYYRFVSKIRFYLKNYLKKMFG